jgi:small subunit ribosomal protein S16
MVKDTDERVRLKPDRIKYWMGVGAKPSEKVAVLFKKYMAKFEKPAAAPEAVPAPEPTPPPTA